MIVFFLSLKRNQFFSSKPKNIQIILSSESLSKLEEASILIAKQLINKNSFCRQKDSVIVFSPQRLNKIMKNHMRQESRLWDYEVLEQIGKGEYGVVYKVRSKRDGHLYALKKVNIANCHEKQKIQAFREVKALRLISHPDIIQYYDSFLSLEHIYIVMEYASKGDLAKLVRDRKLKQKLLGQQELWDMFSTLTSAVKYLHEQGILHRDIKLENIFITEQGKVKLGDLGMSKVLGKEDQLISTRVGTPVYFAPEVIQNQLYTFPVDIWSLGCVFYNLATLDHPFKDATIQTLAYYVIDRDPRPIKGHYGGYLINFINELLTKNPRDRPDIFQACLTIKNRDNPNPPNRVQVYSFKKLLNIKDDLKLLQCMRKVHKELQKTFKAQRQSVEDLLKRRSSFNCPKTYREFIKLNLAEATPAKIKENPENHEHRPPCAPHRPRLPSHSLLLTSSVRRGQQTFSPIKTNGFQPLKQSTTGQKNTPDLSKNEGRQVRALRQSLRRYAS